jgi:hypothetical protein
LRRLTRVASGIAGLVAAVALLALPAVASPSQVPPPPAPTAQPTPSPLPPLPTTVAPPTSTADSPSSGGCSGGVLGSITHAINPWCWVDQLLTDAVRPEMEGFASVAFTTPDITGNPAVRNMAWALVALSDACLILVVLFWAHQVTWSSLVAKGQAKHGLERVVVGTIVANLFLLAMPYVADAANALTSALIGFGGANLEVRVQTLIPTMATAAVNPLGLLLALFVEFVGILVLFWSLVRWLALAMVLSLGGPANLAVGVKADQVTRAWWRSVVILFFCPALQVVAYDLAVWLFFSTNALIPSQNDLLSGLAALVLMWVLYQIPKAALRSTAGPLMEAYDAAKRKVKVGVGLGLIAVGAVTGVGIGGVGARGFSVHGLVRSLVGKSTRQRRRGKQAPTRPPKRPAKKPAPAGRP